MKQNFFIFSYETAKEIRKIAIYRLLTSCLVSKLQSFEDIKIKAKIADTKQWSQLKSIKVDQICDITYNAGRFDEYLNEPILRNYVLEITETW